jgi:hypothetical protein
MLGGEVVMRKGIEACEFSSRMVAPVFDYMDVWMDILEIGYRWGTQCESEDKTE